MIIDINVYHMLKIKVGKRRKRNSLDTKTKIIPNGVRHQSQHAFMTALLNMIHTYTVFFRIEITCTCTGNFENNSKFNFECCDRQTKNLMRNNFFFVKIMVVGPDSITLWIRIGNPDSRSGSRGLK
jgi:hypothetical protein